MRLPPSFSSLSFVCVVPFGIVEHLTPRSRVPRSAPPQAVAFSRAPPHTSAAEPRSMPVGARVQALAKGKCSTSGFTCRKVRLPVRCFPSGNGQKHHPSRTAEPRRAVESGVVPLMKIILRNGCPPVGSYSGTLLWVRCTFGLASSCVLLMRTLHLWLLIVASLQGLLFSRWGKLASRGATAVRSWGNVASRGALGRFAWLIPHTPISTCRGAKMPMRSHFPHHATVCHRRRGGRWSGVRQNLGVRSRLLASF